MSIGFNRLAWQQLVPKKKKRATKEGKIKKTEILRFAFFRQKFGPRNGKEERHILNPLSV